MNVQRSVLSNDSTATRITGAKRMAIKKILADSQMIDYH